MIASNIIAKELNGIYSKATYMSITNRIIDTKNSICAKSKANTNGKDKDSSLIITPATEMNE